MKYSNFVLLSSLSPAFADVAKMQEAIDWFVSNSTSSNGPTARNVQEVSFLLVSDWLDQIDQYGCWCYFGGSYTEGKSKPVSQMDAYCKSLQDGYQCAIMDAGDNCQPSKVAYNLNAMFYYVPEDNQIDECTKANT